jgi:hypothetical protein
MTIHIFVRDASAQEKLSSRPERSEVEGPEALLPRMNAGAPTQKSLDNCFRR